MDEETPKVEEEVTKAIDALQDEDEPLEEEEEQPGEPGETVEDIAKELGWRPKGNFKDDDKDFLSAGEFIRKGNKLRESASKGLKETKRQLESMGTAIQDIKKHYAANTKAQTIRHQKQIDTLSKQRIEAIEEGDPAEVDRLEGEMVEHYNAMETPPTPGPDPADEALFRQWQDDNDWYAPTGKGGDMAKTLYADEEAGKLDRYPDLPYERKLEIVTEKVAKKFSKKAPPVTPVESPRHSKERNKYSVRDLDAESKRVMRSLVNNGDMTQEEYMKDWTQQREA